MHLGMSGDLGGLPCQMAKLSKSTDSGRRKGGVVMADWGEIFGRVRCPKRLIPLRRFDRRSACCAGSESERGKSKRI